MGYSSFSSAIALNDYQVFIVWFLCQVPILLWLLNVSLDNVQIDEYERIAILFRSIHTKWALKKTTSNIDTSQNTSSGRLYQRSIGIDRNYVFFQYWKFHSYCRKFCHDMKNCNGKLKQIKNKYSYTRCIFVENHQYNSVLSTFASENSKYFNTKWTQHVSIKSNNKCRIIRNKSEWGIFLKCHDFFYYSKFQNHIRIQKVLQTWMSYNFEFLNQKRMNS